MKYRDFVQISKLLDLYDGPRARHLWKVSERAKLSRVRILRLIGASFARQRGLSMAEYAAKRNGMTA